MTTTLSQDGRRWTSDVTSHHAWCDDDGWKVTYLPGYWSRNQAITAMTLAETFAHLRAKPDALKSLWPHFRAWAYELGMTAERVWDLLADTYQPTDTDDQAPAVTAVGALHSKCCDAPVVSTDDHDTSADWHCMECGAADDDAAAPVAEQAPAAERHTPWCAEEHEVTDDCRSEWEGHEDDDTSVMVRLLGNDTDRHRYELAAQDQDGNKVLVPLTLRQARRIIAAFDLD